MPEHRLARRGASGYCEAENKNPSPCPEETPDG
jgi:hypothetical protein